MENKTLLNVLKSFANRLRFLETLRLKHFYLSIYFLFLYSRQSSKFPKLKNSKKEIHKITECPYAKTYKISKSKTFTIAFVSEVLEDEANLDLDFISSFSS